MSEFISGGKPMTEKRVLKQQLKAEQEKVKGLSQIVDSQKQTADTLIKKNKRLVEALKYIEGHGIPSPHDTHKTWVSCFLSMSRKAKQALEDSKEK